MNDLSNGPDVRDSPAVRPSLQEEIPDISSCVTQESRGPCYQQLAVASLSHVPCLGRPGSLRYGK